MTIHPANNFVLCKKISLNHLGDIPKDEFPDIIYPKDEFPLYYVIEDSKPERFLTGDIVICNSVGTPVNTKYHPTDKAEQYLFNVDNIVAKVKKVNNK